VKKINVKKAVHRLFGFRWNKHKDDVVERIVTDAKKKAGKEEEYVGMAQGVASPALDLFSAACGPRHV